MFRFTATYSGLAITTRKRRYGSIVLSLFTGGRLLALGQSMINYPPLDRLDANQAVSQGFSMAKMVSFYDSNCALAEYFWHTLDTY